MKALSVRQPWAGLIVAGVKDVENRCWRTSHRGPLLIHASQERARRTFAEVARDYVVTLTDDLAELVTRTGGIVGEVAIVDCVTTCASPWFEGPLDSRGRRNYGFVLRDARALPFRPMPGRLRFFEVHLVPPGYPEPLVGSGVSL
jgi:hypothetical protein